MVIASKRALTAPRQHRAVLAARRAAIACVVVAGILGVAAALAPAPAQQAWPTPARDYSVTYRMTDEEGELRVSFSAARGRTRTEMPESYTIVDQPGRRLWMVLPEQRMAMELPLGEGDPPSFDLAAILHGAEATPLGAGSVAGHACINYRLRFPDDSPPGIACISDEGLILRLEGKDGDKTVEIVATALSFAAQPVARFEVPAGYSIMRQPAGHRGATPHR